jgi:uncharacterized protein (TIGR02588 family)
MNAQASEEATGTPRPRGRTVAEWTMFAATLAVVLLVAGTVAWLWLTGTSSPPRFTITPMGTVSVPGEVHVPVEIHNTGTKTAADVQVVARDEHGRQLLSQTVDYISGGETVQITFVFGEPRSNLTFGIGSFQPPG